jgi:hypothetical protein
MTDARHHQFPFDQELFDNRAVGVACAVPQSERAGRSGRGGYPCNFHPLWARKRAPRLMTHTAQADRGANVITASAPVIAGE